MSVNDSIGAGAGCESGGTIASTLSLIRTSWTWTYKQVLPTNKLETWEGIFSDKNQHTHLLTTNSKVVRFLNQFNTAQCDPTFGGMKIIRNFEIAETYCSLRTSSKETIRTKIQSCRKIYCSNITTSTTVMYILLLNT